MGRARVDSDATAEHAGQFGMEHGQARGMECSVARACSPSDVLHLWLPLQYFFKVSRPLVLTPIMIEQENSYT